MASALQNSSSSKKRRFQPPITNYFAASTPETEENSTLSHHSYAAPTNTPTPTLPSNILSSLLGVGARVRKSVPEGYKTEQKKLTAYTIPAPSFSPKRDAESTTTVYAGLEPFCGMHKVGNYAVQTFPRPDEQYRNVNADDMETFSIPSSSQGSNTSSSSDFLYANPSSNKRAYGSDVEDDYDSAAAHHHHHHHPIRGGFASGDIWQDNAITGFNSSVYTSTPSSSDTISQRTILSPKLSQHRRRIVAASSTSGSACKTHSEQENQVPLTFAGDCETSSGEMMDLDDFGEADFLRRREEVDADYM
jgi:Ribonucleotide reductase inhibitor